MVYQEAIEHLRRCSIMGVKLKDSELPLATATFVAIEALEKQIPKKPYYAHYENAGEKPYIKTKCPCCKACVSAVSEDEKSYQNRYCHKCGQALDWSDGCLQGTDREAEKPSMKNPIAWGFGGEQ